MNIFYLHEDPVQNAKWHIDKHIVKMPIEYAQLMSTAHRMLDGHMYIGRTANGRRIKRWKLQDERDDILYKASHVNHPSAVWVRESIENYFQMYKIYMATLAEFTHRYGKVHGASKPSMYLMRAPLNIPVNCEPLKCGASNVSENLPVPLTSNLCVLFVFPIEKFPPLLSTILLVLLV